MMNCICCISAIANVLLFGASFGEYFTTFCIFITQINMAYNDTVTDALTCQAAKFDVEDGNSILNAMSYCMQGVGAIAGALMAMSAQNNPNIGPY